MLLWIAFVGAALGAYSLALAPFTPIPVESAKRNDRSQRRESDDG
jgi:hypothetical protein